jgi:hypothetical protein
MKLLIEYMITGFLQESLRRYGPDQLAILLNVSASVRIGNNILFGYIEAFGNAFELTQRHTKELSRINVDNAKTIANTAKETVAELLVNRQTEVYA